MESPSGGDSARALVEAALGAAGWPPEAVEVEGQPDPVPTRRYRNARALLRVVLVRERQLTLLVEHRLPLLIRIASPTAADRDPLTEALRLIVEWQDRLGDLDGDAGFWQALVASGAPTVVLRDGKSWPVDWSRVDDTGAAQAGYLVSCACQQLGGDPERADATLIRVVEEIVHESWSEFFCLCRRCGRRWRVESDPGYHFTTYQWTEVTFMAAHAPRFAEPEPTTAVPAEPAAPPSQATATAKDDVETPDSTPEAEDAPRPKNLLKACSGGDLDSVRWFLDGGADIGQRDVVGLGVLHHAILGAEIGGGHGELVTYLLSRGAEIDAKASGPLVRKGFTPLMAAAMGDTQWDGERDLDGHPEIVELLLKAGASVDQMDESGHSALYCAAQVGAVDCVRILLAHGAKPSRKIVDVAREFDHEDVLDLLSPPPPPVAEALEPPNASIVTSMESPPFAPPATAARAARLGLAWEAFVDIDPHALGLSADGAIAVAGEPANIVVWNARTGATIGDFQAKGAGLDHLIVAADACAILSWGGGGGAKRLTIWRSTKKGFGGIRPNLGFTASVNDAAFHPDGVRAVASDIGGRLALFEVASGAVERAWDSGQYAPTIVGFDPAANSVFIAKNDQLAEWGLDSTRPRRSVALDLQNGNVSLTARHPDRRHVALGTRQTDESPCVIVDLHTFTVVARSTPRPHLEGVQFDRAGKRLLVLTDRGGVLETWNADGLDPLSSFTVDKATEHQGRLHRYGGLRPLPDGDHVAAVIEDDQGHSVVVFALASRERIAQWRPSLRTGYSPHTKLAVGANGDVLAASLVAPHREQRVFTKRPLDYHVALLAWRT